MIKLAATTATAPRAAAPSSALIAYRTQRDTLVRECLFLRAEIAHLRHPNPLDTDHDAIKALGVGITELQGQMVRLRKASAVMIHRKPLHVIKPSEPVQITGPGAVSPVVPAPLPGRLGKLVQRLEAVIPAKAEAPTPYEIQQARKAARGKGKPAGETKPKADRAPVERAASHADVQCCLLLARENGATVAEIRAATGWKGPIMGGPLRAAKAAGKTLKWDGAGEARRFTLV